MTKGPVHEHYLGPGQKIGPELLDQYEGHGYWLEEKIDGHWCCAVLDNGEVSFWSRLGNQIVDERVQGMSIIWSRPWVYDGMFLVGELKDRHLYVFDLPREHCWYRGRRQELALNVRHLGPDFSLLPAYSKGFRHIYDAIIADGGEGVVLKHEESYYHSRRKDRKTGFWVKCKPEYSEL